MRRAFGAIVFVAAFLGRCPKVQSQAVPPTSYSVSAVPTPTPTQIYVSSKTPGSYGPYTFWVAVNYPQGQSVLSNPVTVDDFGYPLVITFAPQAGATGYSCIFSSQAGSLPVSLMSASSVQGNTCVLATLTPAGGYVTPLPLAATYQFASGSAPYPAALLSGAIRDAGGQVFNVDAYGAVCDGVTDNTVAFNEAITAAQNAGGGIVFVPGCDKSYNYSTSLVVGDVIIQGAGRNASQLNYTQVSGSAITFNYPVPSQGIGPGLRDLTVIDTLVSGQDATGVTLGGSQGAVSAVIKNVAITGFNIGLAMDANSALWSVSGSYFSDGTDVNIPSFSSSGENLLFSHCTFDHTGVLSSVVIDGSIDLVRFVSDSFDGAQLIVDQGYVDLVSPHFENTITGSYYPIIDGDGTHDAYLTMEGGELWADGTTLPPNNSFIDVNALGVANVSNVAICSGSPDAVAILFGAGEGTIVNPIAANCGAFLNHPFAFTGTGTFTQIAGPAFGNNQAGNQFEGGIGAGKVTVANLPAAASNIGEWFTVTDSTTITTEGQACVGSGTVTAAAFSNGTTWKCF